MKKVKKTVCMLITTIMLIVPFQLININAEGLESELKSPSALLMDPQSGRVLFEKNAHEVRACASITKVMTLLLIMEEIENETLNLNDQIATSAHASSMGGSDIWLEPGETMTANDMIKAVAVASANDAAVALAEHISGTENAFVDKMNEKAKELNMKETVFKNCNGLDEDGHVTSAYDVALMSKELITHELIFQYTNIWMDSLRGGQTQIVNTNKLLKSYQGANGLKTGTTGQAGSCITATATRKDMSLIAVILGSTTGTERFDDATTLLNYGFSNYNNYTPDVPESVFEPIKVTNGMKNNVETEAQLLDSIILEKGEQSNLSTEMNIPENIVAPIIKGQVLGEIIYKLNDEEITKVNIISKEDIEQISLYSVFELMARSLVD